MQKDWFEEIITTIENNAEDNKATISNVKLWAKSWREEKKLALTLYDVVKSFYCVDNCKSKASVDKCDNQCTGCWQVEKRSKQ